MLVRNKRYIPVFVVENRASFFLYDIWNWSVKSVHCCEWLRPGGLQGGVGPVHGRGGGLLLTQGLKVHVCYCSLLHLIHKSRWQHHRRAGLGHLWPAHTQTDIQILILRPQQRVVSGQNKMYCYHTYNSDSLFITEIETETIKTETHTHTVTHTHNDTHTQWHTHTHTLNKTRRDMLSWLTFTKESTLLFTPASKRVFSKGWDKKK